MEVNAFKSISSIVEKGKWFHINEFAVIAAYHLRLAGIHFTETNELTRLLVLMNEVGFIEIDPNKLEYVRVKEVHCG